MLATNLRGSGGGVLTWQAGQLSGNCVHAACNSVTCTRTESGPPWMSLACHDLVMCMFLINSLRLVLLMLTTNLRGSGGGVLTWQAGQLSGNCVHAACN